MKTPNSTNTKEDWFDNVENLRPLRGGRRAETLNEIASGVITVSANDAEKKFCKDFEIAKKSEDPLLIMYSFTNWFEEHFPTGKNYLFYPMLYKICTTFATMEQYKNDERLLKLWVKLAESFPESALAVMEFAYTKGSCRQCAKFYVRWSEMYQAIGHFNRAREKLELGIAMCAAPLPLLHTALDDLETKLKFHASFDNKDDEDDLLEINTNNCRETLGKLRGLGRKHVAPIIRLTQGPPGKVLKSAQKLSKKLKSFEIFVADSPVPNIEEKVFKTPLSRFNIIDDLKNDPDYQALFGFFDDREKVDLQFTTTENSSKSSCKSIKLALNSKTKLKSRALVIPHFDQNFEVYSDEIKENKVLSESSDNIKNKIKINDNSAKKLVNKPKLKIKKCLVLTSIEEAFAKIICKN